MKINWLDAPMAFTWWDAIVGVILVGGVCWWALTRVTPSGVTTAPVTMPALTIEERLQRVEQACQAMVEGRS